MKSCGIDLGTTNSCVHVVSDGSPKLIRDAQGNVTVPSVVYRSRDGKTIVGYSAKNRMGEMNGPVVAIKRKMGSDETVALSGEAKTPVEISAIILRHLKEMAEKAEGETVDRAVVTVPAYFAHIQRQQTDDAARAAGFVEVTTLLEPVAAALAYSLESPRETLRVFVYDLGGGTFDATVLEKDAEGGLNVLSFGGDPYLGGDNFDSRLVKQIVAKLTAKGYKLELDLSRAEDYSRYQRLKFFAETAKIGLTDAESVMLVHQGLFKDQDGELIDLDLTITREEFEGCTTDLVQQSIDESIRTLRKKQIDPASIDDVIMVGGMSSMPLVQQRLKEAFGKEPKLVDPALIVSKGAAIKAAQLYPERKRGEGGLTVDLRYDRQTAKRSARVLGVLNRSMVSGSAYLLGENEERSADLAGKDRFAFDNIPLRENRTNSFTISIEDAAGAAIFGEEIRITHDPSVTTVLVSPGSVVTKGIGVRTLDGPQVLFAENTILPNYAVLSLATADQGGVIRLPIIEGEQEVQRLTIQDIPRDLPVGAEVRIEVSIEADYHIKAQASVPSIQREVAIAFRIEPFVTSSLTTEYIRNRLAELNAAAGKAASECPRFSEVEIFRVRLKGHVADIEMELTEHEPNRLKIREKLVAIESLIHDISLREEEVSMPGATFEQFTQRLTELETGAIEIGHSKLAETRPKIEQLRREAAEAWKTRDRIAWIRANKQIASIASALMPERPPEEWAELIAGFIVVVQLPEVQAISGPSTEIGAIEREANLIFSAMKTGSVPAEVAVQRLRHLYINRVDPLRKKYGLETVELDPGKMTRETSGLTKRKT
jgi:actin-like ATPase involved in cell morphogenesis